jgi:hypothetical protein
MCFLGHTPWLVTIPFVPGLLWAMARLVEWRINHFIFAPDGKLICCAGVPRRQTIVPINFSTVTTRTGFVGRIFDCGTLEVGSNPPHVIHHIERFSEVQRLLLQGSLVRPQEGREPGPTFNPPPNNAATEDTTSFTSPAALQLCLAPRSRQEKARSTTEARYCRFLAFCERVIKMADAPEAVWAYFLGWLSNEQQQFLAVLIRSGLLERGTWHWARRIRTVADVRCRIGLPELDRALAIVQFGSQ